MIISKYHNGFAGSIHNHKNYEKMPISYSMYIIKSVFVSATVAFIGLIFFDVKHLLQTIGFLPIVVDHQRTSATCKVPWITINFHCMVLCMSLQA